MKQMGLGMSVFRLEAQMSLQDWQMKEKRLQMFLNPAKFDVDY